jgi:predicted RNase H-like nuclease (RuvC/YqgF family)
LSLSFHLLYTQERQLKITSAAASEFREEADQSRRKLRELEEQIQSDDRVERLETSLKHTQDRADELEFQLTKLKQVCHLRPRGFQPRLTSMLQ